MQPSATGLQPGLEPHPLLLEPKQDSMPLPRRASEGFAWCCSLDFHFKGALAKACTRLDTHG